MSKSLRRSMRAGQATIYSRNLLVRVLSRTAIVALELSALGAFALLAWVSGTGPETWYNTIACPSLSMMTLLFMPALIVGRWSRRLATSRLRRF